MLMMVVGDIMEAYFFFGRFGEKNMVKCRRDRNQDIGLPRLLGFFLGD